MKTVATFLVTTLLIIQIINAQSYVSFNSNQVQFKQQEIDVDNTPQTLKNNMDPTCGSCITIIGNNVVPNPDMEAQNPVICNNPGINGEMFLDISSIDSWIGATLSTGPNAGITPDHWSSCPGTNVSTPSPGCGGQAIGFYTTGLGFSILEWVQAPLTQTLVSGKKYCLSFDAFSNPFTGFGPADGLSVLLLQNQLDLDVWIPTGSIPFTPVYEHPSGSIIPTTCNRYGITFTATGNENWIAFGNIDPLNTVVTSGAFFSYVAIDNVSVVEIEEGIEVTVTQVGSTCSGQPGSATAVPNGGTAPYTYNWDNGQTTATATGLTSGTHTVTITDSAGCSGVGSITISGSVSLSVAVSLVADVDCFNNSTGSATANVSGGTPAYTYSWDNGETTPTAIALNAGTHIVTVSDTGGCSGTGSITINQPSALGITLTATSSNDCSTTCTGEISTTPAGGSAPYQYTWSNGAITGTVTGLCSGSYIVTITDSNGCTVIDSAIVIAVGKIEVLTDVTDVSCGVANGVCTALGSGGGSGFTYLWNTNETTATISGLAMGIYTVSVTDSDGCCAIVSMIVGMDDCCTATANPCVDAIQGTLNICVEIGNDPNIPLSTIDCDGDGVTNADECTDTTDPLDPCDYIDTSITLPVIADQSGCPVPCADLTPVTTLIPSNIAGNSAIEVAIEITEIAGIDTDGTIVSLRVPSDPRLVFVWNIGLTQAAGITVQNADWNYLGNNGVFHNWTYNGNGQIIPGNSTSSLGFQAFYDPQATDGQTTITSTIVPFSGGDCQLLNNTDSERLVYFR